MFTFNDDGNVTLKPSNTHYLTTRNIISRTLSLKAFGYKIEESGVGRVYYNGSVWPWCVLGDDGDVCWGWW